ncbi:protein EXORDIUM-like 2 [Panicum miliaceum]|uniref:Protein EXORDIUM-like 2 n=1 Tax=Panicum miliaceum TaxID=4540 RepID=A0A3L6S0Z5_PANMI|nr:protein EXORDIUM-like 2 [Panicum miliaceum]
MQTMGGGRKKPAFPPLLIRFVLAAVVLISAAAPRCAAFNPRMLFLVKPDPIVLRDHGGALLTGNLTVNLLFYGRFTPAQRAIVADFVRSISAAAPARPVAAPTVASWWRTTSLYRGGGARVALGRQILDARMSLGRGPLSPGNVTALARAAGHHRGAVTAVLTAADVAVAPFCVSRCGAHGRDRGGAHGRARPRRRARPGAVHVPVGGEPRAAVPRPVRVAVPPAAARAPGPAARAAQRRRRRQWHGHKPRRAPRRHGHQPLRGRVLPGRGRRRRAGGRHGMRRDLRERGLPRLPREAAHGPGHRRELQRRRAGREEVPAPGVVEPDDLAVQDTCLDVAGGRRPHRGGDGQMLCMREEKK